MNIFDKSNHGCHQDHAHTLTAKRIQWGNDRYRDASTSNGCRQLKEQALTCDSGHDDENAKTTLGNGDGKGQQRCLEIGAGGEGSLTQRGPYQADAKYAVESGSLLVRLERKFD